MNTISLNGIWQLRGRPQEGDPGRELLLHAVVPGCVQLDLSREGYLPADLYMGENIRQTEAYEDWEWWYERTFTAPEQRDNVWLVFEGVDCLAQYYINGQKIGESENMLIPHEFEISRYVQEGENTLTVHLSSPVIAAHNRSYPAAALLAWGPAEETAVRKAPHGYGWDIMPRAVTAGLWREVRIEVRDPVYFSQLYFMTADQPYSLLYELCGPRDLLTHLEIEVEGCCGESRFYTRQPLPRGKTGRVDFTIPDPKLWWPYGYGEAHVYDAVIRLYRDGVPVQQQTASFGLRSIELERTDSTDGHSGRFRFLINGVEIMCKGTNWVPLDAFHCRDAARYDAALALVKDIGCNMLRCWGGNVYEDHAFFDFCDRNGIMVWQDFAMACRFYPQDEGYQRQIREEATALVRRLRNHPSLVLWAGDNEVDVMLASDPHPMDPAINHLTRRVLPQVVGLNDPTRPYLPSSPYVADTVYRSGSLRSCPEDHLWGPRDYYKSDYYKNSPAHFVSEIGYHGCPSLESIRRFITPDRVWPYTDNPEWILHSSDQKGDPGRVLLMEKQVRELFGQVPTDPEEYVLASQICQAEAKKYFIERMRAGRPDKTGILWWNLLDGWPQMSDAVVDYYFTKKRAYEYIKRSQAPFAIIAGEPEDGVLKLLACNDTLGAAQGSFTVTDGLTDALLLEGSFTAPENATTCIGEVALCACDQRFLMIRWTADGATGFNHYTCGERPLSLDAYKRFIHKHNL